MLVETIDLHYLGTPEAVAVYLVHAPRGPFLIETGPGVTVPALASALKERGLAPSDIGLALVTHIHLDHAGAAGWLASHGATIGVHDFGARHLIDPSRLIESATRIYGDRMATLWGEFIAVPAAQVLSLHDGQELDALGLRVRVVESPGHARHHHAFAIEHEDGMIAFTGDAAATYVRQSPAFISLPTPPPEFDLEAWERTLDRFEALSCRAIYPTHFGAIERVTEHLGRVRKALREHVGLVRSLSLEGLSREAMLARYRAWFFAQAEDERVPAEKHPFFVKGSLVDMNLTGILRYWSKRDERPS